MFIFFIDIELILMFNRYDLETVTIKVLNDNMDKWFSRAELFNDVKSVYNLKDVDSNNWESELFIGHYLFVWEKLFANTNFIQATNVNSHNFVKIKTNEKMENDSPLPPINLEERILDRLEVNLVHQINHMINNPSIYTGSKMIEKYLVNSNPKYPNLYDLVLDSKSGLGEQAVCKFIDTFGDSLKLNSCVSEYILSRPLTYGDIQVSSSILNYLNKIQDDSNIKKEEVVKPEQKSPNLDWAFYIAGGGVALWGIFGYYLFMK